MEDNLSNALLMAAAMIVFIIAVTVTFSLMSLTKATSDTVLYSYDDTKYYVEGFEDIAYTLPNENELNRIVDIEEIMATTYRYIKENFGVTIINKDGDILARFDSETEGYVSRWPIYDNLKPNQVGSTDHQNVTRFYENLIHNLKSVDIYEENSSGEIQKNTIKLKWISNPDNHDEEDWDEYKQLKSLWQTIYKQTGGANGIPYGAPFSGKPFQIAKRLNADFGGGDVPFNNGYVTYHGVMQDDGGLLKKYKDKNFQEVFIFVSDNSGTETDEETGDSVIIKANTTKLEIIYVLMED